MRLQAISMLMLAGGVAACEATSVHERGAAAIDGPLPNLTDTVVSDNGYCVFQDAPPHVLEVRWDSELVRAAIRALGPGYRSTITYSEWKTVYGLESQSHDDYLERKAAAARNFIRVLCGENRDYPEMIERKLRLLANGDPAYRQAQGLSAIPREDEPAQVYAGPGEMEELDLEGNLFAQITYPAYERMLVVMKAVHAYRQSMRRSKHDGYHYGFRDREHTSNRVEHSVRPWTHCEMKFMFDRYMGAASPLFAADWGGLHCDVDCAAEYVAQYDQYQLTSCDPEDFETMYDFRGHKVLQAQWLDSNGFLWSSRSAGTISSRTRIQEGDPSYYLHPFATRYVRTRQLLGTYLLYPETHHRRLIAASERGGGPIMYVTDQDSDGDNLADYLLLPEDGCGDTGPSEDEPGSNCNMVSWATAASALLTARHASSWNPALYGDPDLGLLQAFPVFETRIARVNQALDRHTNWGPTGYYAQGSPVKILQGGEVVAIRPGFFGSYSPFVASSYDVSASDSFARRDYESTHPIEQGHTKWIFVIRFSASDYYDETDLESGRAVDFDRHYFNETSLSNDYYRERGLDRFGWVPTSDVYANIYFVYGSRGEEPEPIVELPMPEMEQGP